MLGNFLEPIFKYYTKNLFLKLENLSVIESQNNTLLNLVRAAERTDFGIKHNFNTIYTIDEFQKNVPLRKYENFWDEYWKNDFPNISGKSWYGKINYFALTSGTTGDNTKYIPVSKEMLISNNLAALTLQGGFYSSLKNANLLDGKFLYLGGSTSLQNLGDKFFAGDLSAIAIKEAPKLLNFFTAPRKSTALLSNWEEKLKQIVEQTLNERITGISGVPSWMLLLFAEAKRLSGKNKIKDIWPSLQLIIHGGIKFDPYKKTFFDEVGEGVNYLEVYPASEGFFAFEDLRFNKLRLMLNHGIFYEFVPVDELDKTNPTRLSLFNVRVNENYAIVISTCSGLFAYIIGDTVTFESINPPLIRFTGRTKYFLSAFGEHLISEEIESAVAHVANKFSLRINDFHVGPVFPQKSNMPGFHRYFIEVTEKTVQKEMIANEIDNFLRNKNADYDAHRIDNLSISSPEIILVNDGFFNSWMKERGKFGGQNKVPRIDNSGEITIQLYERFL